MTKIYLIAAKSIAKYLYNLVYPDLKSNKHYDFIEDNKQPCATCGKTRHKAMYHKESDKTYCPKCYLRDVGSELKVTLSKRRLSLSMLGLALVFMLLAGTIVYLLIPSRYFLDIRIRNAIVEFYLPYIDPTVSRDVLEKQITTAMKYPYWQITIPISFWESRCNPTANGIIIKKGSRAKGHYQILTNEKQSLNLWVNYLKDRGAIREERDLYDPVHGTVAGQLVFAKHLEEEKGDILMALKKWVGSKEPAEQIVFSTRVLATMGAMWCIVREVEDKTYKGSDDMSVVFNDKKTLVFKPVRRM